MDIAIQWDPSRFRGDWGLTAGDIGTSAGLETAVLLSLFTDRIAAPGYVPPAGSPPDRHGWWGDTFEPSHLGSRLWQLNRSVKTDGTTLLAEARDYCVEALQWLIDSGVVATIDVSTFWLTRDAIGIQIVIAEPQSPPAIFDYAWAWEGVGVGVVLASGSASSPNPASYMLLGSGGVLIVADGGIPILTQPV